MPKRTCPFAESHVPQMKNHIGLKEINLGVTSHERMEEVYDRTLKLLYDGARKENSCPQTPTTYPVNVQKLNVLPGQRKLNFYGQLDGCYTSNQCKSQKKFLPIACSSCQNIPSVPSTCHFCEKCLCEVCSRLCSDCNYSFCSDCSSPRYESHDVEKSICLSCI